MSVESQGSSVFWSFFLDFGNSSFFSSVTGALCGAFAGAYIAHRIAEKHTLKGDLTVELRNTNAAIVMSMDICNRSLAIKRQHLKAMLKTYEQDRETVLRLRESPKKNHATKVVFEYSAEFHTLPKLTFPIDTLRDQLFERLSILNRPLALISTITDAADQFNSSILNRNTLIVDYRQRFEPGDPRLNHEYFGLTSKDGHRNTMYPDTLRAICSYNDDLIFFSRLLGEDLLSHGKKLAKELKKISPKEKPKVNQLRWSKEDAGELFPPEENYAGWQDGFTED